MIFHIRYIAIRCNPQLYIPQVHDFPKLAGVGSDTFLPLAGALSLVLSSG